MITVNFSQVNSKTLDSNISYLVKRIKDVPDVNIIETNGSVGAILQDYKEFKLYVIDMMHSGIKKYKIGNIDKIEVYVDPYMKWSDNRIILKKDETIIDEIEVIGANNVI